MAVRLFEYGYAVALRKKVIEDGIIKMRFPSARVIYWETASKTPDKEKLHLEFPDGSWHEYEIGTIKILEYSIEEIERKKLTDLVAKDRTVKTSSSSL